MACLQLQTMWRQQHAWQLTQQRRQDRAATVLQAAWRGHHERRARQLQDSSVRVLQRAWRQAQQKLQQQRAAQQVRAACRLQGAIVATRQRQASREQLRHCIQMQARWRGQRVRTQIAKQYSAAVQIQAAWRGFESRSDSAFLFLLPMERTMRRAGAAPRIQALLRGHQVRSVLARADSDPQSKDNIGSEEAASAVRVQAAWRRTLARRRVEEIRAAQVWTTFCGKRDAAITIQSLFRGNKLRRVHPFVPYLKAWRLEQGKSVASKPAVEQEQQSQPNRKVADCIAVMDKARKLSAKPAATTLAEFLEMIGLKSHLARFQRERITYEDLQLLTLKELEDIGFPLVRQHLAEACAQLH